MALTNLAHFGEVRLTNVILLGYIWLMDNTEGSRAIKQTYKVRKSLALHLSTNQLAILLGSILGDAHIHPQGKICIEHGRKQKEYLLWKFSHLKSLAYPKVSRVVRFNKRIQKQTVSWRFFLRQYFRPLRNAFYCCKQKVVPPELKLWISPLLIAVWYMDDGHLDRGKYPSLMTDSFSEADSLLLIKYLNYQFSLNSTLTNKGRILINSESRDSFFKIIKPYIHKSLFYKLP